MSCSFLTALAVLSLISTSAAAAATPPAPPRRPPRGASTAAEFLSAVNAARATVGGVPPLSWNATVAARAKAEVSWIRASAGCELAQANRSPVAHVGGTTLYRSYDRRRGPADAVWLWMSERRWYDHGTNTCAPGRQCGDYTILVTRAWQQLGCAVVACPAGGTFVACEYAPGTNRLPDPKLPPY